MDTKRFPTLLFTAGIGVAGGAAIIAANDLSTYGPLVLVPYALILIVTALYLRRKRIERFAGRFNVSLGAFMIATLVVYVWILTIDNPQAVRAGVWPLLWPLAMMICVGSALSAGVAALTRVRQNG